MDGKIVVWERGEPRFFRCYGWTRDAVLALYPQSNPEALAYSWASEFWFWC